MHTLIYGRVSTGHQQNSIDIQDRDCELFVRAEYAQKTYGVSPVGCQTITDENVSGAIELFQRPGGARLKELIETGQVRHLVVLKLDRLGRNAQDLLTVWNWLAERKVQVYVLRNGIFPDNAMGKMMFQILAIFAEFERDSIRSRIQDTFDQKFARGEIISVVPYGARAVDAAGHDVQPLLTTEGRTRWPKGTLLTEEPEEAAWIRQMWEWYTTPPAHAGTRLAVGKMGGHGVDKIARMLNERGVPTKDGGRWTGGKVHGTLHGRWVREHVLAPGHTAAAGAEATPLAA